ncbi:hypothetical protein PI124_g6839 [Phytophthora idaei]|nr:hypothetical protein PI125_g6518 [Phytophthora idaei]KAG3163064.1 hypothetical protein PI126_g5714 [Phytophthora idaei]KAG3248481.1 hypothetical protein PI124_g6839 [Phytophthora idaei]
MPPSSLHWDEFQMPSQHGRLVIVTGANAGLGFATSLGFARAGAHVILACRNETRGLEAQKQINGQVHADKATEDAVGGAEYMQLDVGSLQSVRDFASAFKTRFSGRRLDILVLNAGVKPVEYGETVDGFEQQFGVNHLGHFALTALLLPVMKKDLSGAGGVPPARVVSISSVSNHGISLDMKQLSAKPKNYDAMDAYRASKLANLLFAYELHRRLKRQAFLPNKCCQWRATPVSRRATCCPTSRALTTPSSSRLSSVSYTGCHGRRAMLKARSISCVAPQIRMLSVGSSSDLMA